MTVIFRSKNIPVAQNVLAPTIEASLSRQMVDVKIEQDIKTGIVINSCFVPANIYDANYENTQSYSGVYRKVLQRTIEYLSDYCEGPFLEIGCGDGEFLKLLCARTLNQIQGFDPALSDEGDVRFTKGYFDIDKLKIAPKTIILRHVLEHMDDPLNFLQMLKSHFPKSKIYIETPNFDWKIQNNFFLDFYNEHKFYFTKYDFERMFSHSGKISTIFGGQYLSGLFSLTDYVNDLVFIKKNYNNIEVNVTKLIESENPKVIWGASSRGVLLTTYLKNSLIPIEAIVDINPNRVGLYVPGTSIKVLGLADVMDLDKESEILITNRNFTEEIKKITNNKFNYKEYPGA